MRGIYFASVLLVGCSLSGCAGQLKAAMVEHAKATQSVAGTLSQVAADIQCEGSKDVELCSAAVSMLNEQVKALQDSAENLEKAGQ